VQLTVWPEMWHVWHSWAASVPESQQAVDQVGKYIRDRLHIEIMPTTVD
jgi:epsilon-lactone hydrolase